MYPIFDMERELMSYCIRNEGKWWANHFFRNKEVNQLYDKLRRLPSTIVMDLIQSNDDI